MVTYTVNIVNKSGVDNQRYIAFLGNVNGKVKSQSNEKLRSIVFFLSKQLGRDRTTEFQFSNGVYGFVGGTTVRSSALAPGHKVKLTADKEVKLGDPKQDNGTELTVSPTSDGEDMNLESEPGKSPGGTFTIFTNSNIESPNFYVTGIARQIDTGNPQIRPVAALPLVPGQKNVIDPSLTLYIGLVDQGDTTVSLGSVVDADNVAVKTTVAFASGQKEVTVTHTAERTFTVV